MPIFPSSSMVTLGIISMCCSTPRSAVASLKTCHVFLVSDWPRYWLEKKNNNNNNKKNLMQWANSMRWFSFRLHWFLAHVCDVLLLGVHLGLLNLLREFTLSSLCNPCIFDGFPCSEIYFVWNEYSHSRFLLVNISTVCVSLKTLYV